MKENSPIKIARKLLLGTMLGDSSIRTRSKKKAHLVMVHSNSQFNYLIWKAKKLVPLVGKFDVDEREVRLRGRGTGKFRTQLRSLSSKYLKHIYDDFYFEREGKTKKEVHKNILNRLTPISIAVWYGDDGNLHPRGSVKIATCGFSKKEVDLICSFLLSKYGFRFAPVDLGNGYLEIKANKEDSVKFLNLVRPYLWEVEDIRYKLDVSYNKSSDHSARHPFINYWDDDVLRTPKATWGDNPKELSAQFKSEL